MLNLHTRILVPSLLVRFTAALVVHTQARSASALAWPSSSEAGGSQEQYDLLSEAQSLAEKNMAADAEPLARRYLDKHPDSASGHFLLGYILFAELREHPATYFRRRAWLTPRKSRARLGTNLPRKRPALLWLNIPQAPNTLHRPLGI